MKLKILDYQTLVALNKNSIQEGRNQTIAAGEIRNNPEGRYPVNFSEVRQGAGQPTVRMSVVLDPAGMTAWLDISPEEFAAIPEVGVSELEWGAAMCAGTPPLAP